MADVEIHDPGIPSNYLQVCRRCGTILKDYRETIPYALVPPEPIYWHGTVEENKIAKSFIAKNAIPDCPLLVPEPTPAPGPTQVLVPSTPISGAYLSFIQPPSAGAVRFIYTAEDLQIGYSFTLTVVYHSIGGGTPSVPLVFVFTDTQTISDVAAGGIVSLTGLVVGGDPGLDTIQAIAP